MFSMKKNRNYIIHLLVTAVCLILQGCSASEEDLWGLGAFVFLIFVGAITLSSIIPRIQEISKIQRLIKILEVIANRAFPFLACSSIALISVGAYTVINSADRSRLNLLIFIGTVCLYLSVNIRKWANETDTHKKRNYVRMIGLSGSFLLIFIYLMLGAPNVKL